MQFEQSLRSNILAAAQDMNIGGTRLATFRTSFCNKDYWVLTNDGGFLLKDGVTPADGIRDIFKNGKKYGFECATAIVIIFYKAVLDTLGSRTFNDLFSNLLLYSWQTDSDLGITTFDGGDSFAQPGDAMYFKNPDVNREKMIWQGENVIKMGDDLYYGHGVGIKPASSIIQTLNRHRKAGATTSAYLKDDVTFPGYENLSRYAPVEYRQLSFESPWANIENVRTRIGALKYVRR
ncbi:MAG: hypothetical protein K0S39_3853 [Paenibacillus sp.]|jgi:protein-glutamine gamma-glutamyltransferase|nr:hypothetical protein [Paenibacillus sp.]